MFLLYFSQGERRYGCSPVAVYPRKAWAFQFNLAGTSSMLIREGGAVREVRLEGSYATVAGPECVHGWGGRPADLCEIRVFQFDDADSTLQAAIGPEGYRCLKITPADCQAVEAIHGRCAAAQKDFLLSPVVYRIAASELALLILKKLPPAELGPPPDFAASKVASALAWYQANLSHAPAVREVAGAVHLSTAHLRRLFHRVRRLSPQAAFTRVQFERATELMRDPTLTLERIAESTGFGSSAAFSRAFKAAFGKPPKVYRAFRASA